MLLAAILGLSGLSGCQSESEQNFGIVNTPLIISQLAGVWEKQTTAADPFPQRLIFNPDGCGSIQRSKAAVPPAEITYRVDGLNLTIQYYFDQDVPRNWRTRTLVYRYEITSDTLTLRLIRNGEIETWRKIKTLHRAPSATPLAA